MKDKLLMNKIEKILDNMEDLDVLMNSVELIVHQLNHQQIKNNISLFKDQLGQIAGDLFKLQERYERNNDHQ